MSPIWMSFAEVLRASGSWGLEWVALQVISMIAACEQPGNVNLRMTIGGENMGTPLALSRLFSLHFVKIRSDRKFWTPFGLTGAARIVRATRRANSAVLASENSIACGPMNISSFVGVYNYTYIYNHIYIYGFTHCALLNAPQHVMSFHALFKVVPVSYKLFCITHQVLWIYYDI